MIVPSCFFFLLSKLCQLMKWHNWTSSGFIHEHKQIGHFIEKWPWLRMTHALPFTKFSNHFIFLLHTGRYNKFAGFCAQKLFVVHQRIKLPFPAEAAAAKMTIYYSWIVEICGKMTQVNNGQIESTSTLHHFHPTGIYCNVNSGTNCSTGL